MTTKIEQAESVMKLAHSQQKRWDGRPYYVHPQKVVEILNKFQANQDIIIAGYLHDVLEDTTYTADQIKVNFGEHVYELVQELTFVKTDDKSYWDQCAKMSKDAKIIKIADILANITDNGRKSNHFINKRVQALKLLID